MKRDFLEEPSPAASAKGCPRQEKKVVKIAMGGAVAALYVVLTFLSSSMGLASGAVQVRLSEALTVLPVFAPAAIPGLAVGCFLANLLTGCALPDVIFGTLATLAGAVGTRLLKNHRFLCLLPPIGANTLVVPIVLAKVYGVETAWPLLALSIFAGEAVSCGLLGGLLYKAVEKHRHLLRF